MIAVLRFMGEFAISDFMRRSRHAMAAASAENKLHPTLISSNSLFRKRGWGKTKKGVLLYLGILV